MEARYSYDDQVNKKPPSNRPIASATSQHHISTNNFAKYCRVLDFNMCSIKVLFFLQILQLMNKICTPVPHPEYPEDYAETVLISMDNGKMLAEVGPGLSWLRSSRLSIQHYFPLSGLFKLVIFAIRYQKTLNDKLKMLCENSKD